MTHKTACRLALVLPLCVSAYLLFVARGHLHRAEANKRECAACAHTLESLAPYLAQVRAYEAAKARLAGDGTEAKAPEPRLGVPPAERSSERGKAVDGWVPVRETYSWPSLKTGQALAVLEAFSSNGGSRWRISSLRLSALPDGENASLAVTLETAEPEAARE